MFSLIIGGSGSGKSEYAESMALELKKNCEDIYYLATMKPEGAENRKRISRHLALREGKGFITIEQSVNISAAFEKKDNVKLKNAIVILECVSNLAANEMFDDGVERPERVAAKITSGIEDIQKKVKHLLVVSNNIHEDGVIYDELTEGYINAVGTINRNLGAMADRVIEVVVGIPIVVK